MPDLNKAQAGMVPRNYSETHLYHESKPPVIAYTEADEKAACFDKDGNPTGYGREYIPQDYPKLVDGVLVQEAPKEAV